MAYTIDYDSFLIIASLLAEKLTGLLVLCVLTLLLVQLLMLLWSAFNEIESGGLLLVVG